MDPENSTNTASIEELLHDKVQKWRGKLLDIGNRNPLVSCSFNASRGVIEIVTPDSESVWRRLAADSEAGADPMRFPWRRELVPPPAADGPNSGSKKSRLAQGESFSERGDPGPVSPSHTPTPNEPMTAVDWNPSLNECRMSPRLRETDLLTEMSDRVIERRLRTVDGHARLAMSEQGVHVLYIAFGFLKWFESKDSEDERRSPLILVPVTLSRKSTSAPWELTEAEDDAIDNLCLRQRLRQDFSLELPPLPDINELEDLGARTAFLDSVRTTIRECDRWEVEDRVAIGLFAFPKVAMWKDLGDHTKAVMNHPLCRSIGGDTTIEPIKCFGPVGEIPDGNRLDDDVPPGEVKAILDCDSSQLEAIVAARRGVSLVLDGPPGTGKSQTIANIIADALSEGRTVLFVSEKVSALGVVKRRLDEKGLGDFCLECHSSKANRKSVLYELESCLGLEAEVYHDAQPKLDEVKQKRDVLNDYIRSVHRPRMPLGLSPYELYGQVGRLKRLGFAGKSRCILPDPANVNRTTFGSWLRLLGRAVDSAEVIKTHATHPWRGCKLTSQSLSLADDLKHHLTVLVSAFESIDRALSPLVAEALLTESPTPSTLIDTLNSIVDSLNAPEIPAVWFDSPVESTNAMLNKLNMDETEWRLRSRLSHFNDDIASEFPASSFAALTTAENRWMQNLEHELPDSVRRQGMILHDLNRRLVGFSECLSDAESHLESLVTQLRIPIKSDLPIGAISKLIELARSISDCGTMRPAWLTAENWTRLRQAAGLACSDLNDADTIAATFHDRVPATQLRDLAGCVQNVEELNAAWGLIELNCPLGTPKQCEHFSKFCIGLTLAINEALDSGKSLWRSLGLSGDHAVTLREAKCLAALAPAIGDGGIVNSSWVDAALCIRLRTACDAAVEDIEEANALREVLSSRLSHRAFKEASLTIAARAPQYSSFLKRLFGGFAAFKKDVAELYKARLPGTADLLSDMDRLHRHHRRISDVRSAADEHRQFIPPNHDALDAGAWRQLKSAVIANESFFGAAGPMGVSAGCFTRVDSVAVSTSARQLSEALSRIYAAIDGTPLVEMFETTTLDEIAKKVAVKRDAATICHGAVTKAGCLYVHDPPSIRQLVKDVALAIRHEEVLSRVNDAFLAHSESMPVGSTATDASTWKRVTAGVNAAERLSLRVRNTQALQPILCKHGGIDADALNTAIDGATASYQNLHRSMEQCEALIRLSPSNEPEIETGRRPISWMKSIVISATEALDHRLRELQEIIGVLRDESDASITRMPEDVDTITRLQAILTESAVVSQRLAELRIADLCDSDKPKILWLAEFAASGRLSNLIRSVASSTEQRERCHWILTDVRSAMSGDFKPSWDFLKSVFDLKTDVSSGITISNAAVGQLAVHLKSLHERAFSIDDWLKFARWRRDIVRRQLELRLSDN